ncbi:MAG: protein kinase [Methanoregula sp.]|jgi:hypothetical protein
MKYVILMVLLVSALLGVSPVYAAVLIANSSGNGDSVQSLINSSVNGDSILLKSGNYYENLVIDRPITVGAADRNNPPHLISLNGTAGISLVASGAVLDGIIISGDARYGLLVHSDNNEITNLSINGMETGIGLESATHNEIARSRITKNSIGVDVDKDSQANTFFMNYFDNPLDVSSESDDVTWSSLPWLYWYEGKNFTGPLGNFWKKYSGIDPNGDGIGNIPYIVQQNESASHSTSADRSVTDSAPLMQDPESYILGKAEKMPTTGQSGLLPKNNFGLPVTPSEIPGPQGGPVPGYLFQFWWIVPIAIVVSVIAGIWFERTWKRRSMVAEPDETEVRGRNATVVKPLHPVPDTPTYEQAHYAAHLPPALERKYPTAEYVAEGGVSRVFRAYDEKEGREVAVKVPIRFDEVTGSQFTKELHVWEGLHHKNIVEIYTANIFPVPYIEMEYVETTLASQIFPLDTEKATAIITGVAQGLRYAHKQGIVHRDIKPENIMLAPDGTPKISDWGLSKAEGTKHSGLIGFSLEYAAPEQLAPNIYGEPGAWTDIYQIGVLFYEMVTGQVPFTGGGMGEVTHAILHDDPPRLALDSPDAEIIAGIIKKCLQKNPKDRYGSVAELIADLQKIKIRGK